MKSFKTIPTINGWVLVTIEEFEVRSKVSLCSLCGVDVWLDTRSETDSNKLYKRCSRCLETYKPGGQVFIVFMKDQINQHICQKCADRLRESFGES